MPSADAADPSNPITAAATAHRLAHATYVAAHERVVRLLEPVDPDLIGEDDDAVLRPAFKEAHGCLAEVELARYHVAQIVSEATGRQEDEVFERFEALELRTAEDVEAYRAYMLEHAGVVGEIERAVILHRLADRLGDTLRERLAA